MAKPNPQAAYYASLGRSVAKTARVQKTRAKAGRNITTGARKRQAPTSTARQGAAFGTRPARALPQPVRPVAPKPISQTPAQLAASRRNQYVSQGKAVEKAAKSQKRQVYADRPLAARRQIVTQAHITAPKDRTAEQNIAMQVHHERHAGDVAQIKRIGMTERAADRLGATQRAEHVSQGQAVAKAAKEPKPSERDVKIGQFKVPEALTETDPVKLKAAGFAPDKASKVFQAPLKALSNVPKDVKELAVTTPTSLAKTGTEQIAAVGESIKKGSVKPIAKAEVKTAKSLAKPYTELYHHPVKFATEHPVTTGLMLAPTAKAPGLTAGRVLRVAGKQTLERPAATMEGTTLTERRTGSRSALKRHQQTREDRGQAPLTAKAAVKAAGRVVTLKASRERVKAKAAPEAAAPKPKAQAHGPRISRDELDRRIDEAYDLSGQHRQNAVASKLKDAKAKHKDLPKPERLAKIQEDVQGAAEGAGQHSSEMIAREFGSHWYRDPNTGAIIKPKNVGEGGGHIHADKADAEAIAQRVPFDAKVMKLEGQDAWAVVPERVAQRIQHHQKVGTAGQTGAVLLRTPSKLFRRTVLPTSTKWLGGQVAEAGVRAAAMGAGPTSLLRGRRLLKAVEAEHGRGEMLRLRGRTTQGGQFGATGPTAEFAKGGIRTLAEDFKGTGLEREAQVLTNIGHAPGLRHARAGYRGFSSVVFNHLNGRIEEAAKTAMLGKALKQSPLLEKHVGRLSDQAIQEAAKGLKSTSSQVELGRAIDRAYGRYSKMGPHAREMIVHSTPFFPWFANMSRFLFKVMPHDHPVRTALVADMNAADQEWRKAHGQSYYAGKKRAPDWLMGSLPSKGGNTPVGRFGPFLPGEFTSATGGQVVPQMQGILQNLAGSDWTGKELKGKSQENLAAQAALTGAEAMVPGVSVANRLTGVGDRYVRGKKTTPAIGRDKSLGDVGQSAVNLLNPVRKIKPAEKKKRKSKKKSGGSAGYGGFGGGGGGSSTGYSGF